MAMVKNRERIAVKTKEVPLARPGAYKSEKRKKELLRLKKQQEKRQRRLNKDAGHPQDESTELIEPEGGTQEQQQES
jgi:hypothetical protein